MAKSGKLLGTTVQDSVIAGPQALYGQTISLNLKACKWFLPRTADRNLYMDASHPTIQIPGPGQVATTDLECIILKMKAGHIVLGPKPIPEFTKDADTLGRHTGVMTAAMPNEFVLNHITSIVNGPQLDGGYYKLELLETMLSIEEGDLQKGIKGKNRAGIIKHLKDAIDFVTNTEGGVSKVVREERVVEPSSSGRTQPPAEMTPEKAKKFLGVE